MNVAVSAGMVFGGLTVGTALITLVATYADCSKVNYENAFKNGAITGAISGIVYFLGAYFDIIRGPFVVFFQGFGLEEDMAIRIALGYMIMLVVWPLTVWSIHNSTTVACVPTVDEMSKFKTDLLEKLKAKQQAQAAQQKPAA